MHLRLEFVRDVARLEQHHCRISALDNHRRFCVGDTDGFLREFLDEFYALNDASGRTTMLLYTLFNKSGGL